LGLTRKNFAPAALFVLLTAADRATKLWALSSLEEASGGSGKLFSLGLYFNRGISFSLLDDYAPAGLALALTGAFILLAACISSRRFRRMPGLVFLCAGAAGNLTDRLLYGYVVDWVRIAGYVNAADIWLAVGCLLFLVHCAGESARGS
jgi:lipoprotein signal peptidase